MKIMLKLNFWRIFKGYLFIKTQIPSKKLKNYLYSTFGTKRKKDL
jgi:hypothetical protein